MSMEFLKRYNNYDCILRNDCKSRNKLSHYTDNSVAVINISNGCFWATDLPDFDDELEGKLIFKRINEILSSENIAGITTEYMNYIERCIGDDEKIKAFMDKFVTNVVSLCNNTDSGYMWDKYAKNDGYNIIFDKATLVSSLHFYAKNGEQKDNPDYFKHALIEYEENEQIKVVHKEIVDLLAAQKDDFDADVFIDYLLRHLMFVGNYYKSKEGIEKGNYKKYVAEQEYRILTNTYGPYSLPGISEALPEHIERERDGKKIKYIKMYFDPTAITKIICRTDKAKSLIEREIPNVLLEVKSDK